MILQLSEAAGFALAGGAALLVHEVTDRGTNDNDCFGPSVAAVDGSRTCGDRCAQGRRARC